MAVPRVEELNAANLFLFAKVYDQLTIRMVVWRQPERPVAGEPRVIDSPIRNVVRREHLSGERLKGSDPIRIASALVLHPPARRDFLRQLVVVASALDLVEPRVLHCPARISPLQCNFVQAELEDCRC